MITIRWEPSGETLTMDKLKTMRAVFKRLGLDPCEALSILEETLPGEDATPRVVRRLVTHDTPLAEGATVVLRRVGSRG